MPWPAPAWMPAEIIDTEPASARKTLPDGRVSARGYGAASHHFFGGTGRCARAYTAAMHHFAHSRKERPPSEWHRLDQHLRSTAERAERFASPFAKDWGRLAGLWHDVGKYQKAFQDYLFATGDHTGPKVD